MILRYYDFRSPLQDTIGLIIRIFICIVLLYALAFNIFYILEYINFNKGQILVCDD